MERNKLHKVVICVVLVVLMLLVLRMLPGTRVGDCTLRRVDILSDLRLPSAALPADTDTLPLPPPPPAPRPAFADTCPTGMTCIEEYADSTDRGMAPFYRALDERVHRPRPVRIAYFGDSFIEADILTADLRCLLQQRFGGRGVGFVTITSITSGFRPTVRHRFGGWQSHSIMDTLYFDRSKQGLSGHYFVPSTDAYVELKGQTKYASHLDSCDRAGIYFFNRGEVEISVSVNRGPARTQRFLPTGELQSMQVEGRIGEVRWQVNRVDSTLFYGLAMDDSCGIAVDNFSLRGNSGLSLRSVPIWMMREFNEQRPYDLIILQYGLNVATERGRNYDAYAAGMTTVLRHLKEAFPQAGILVVSVGDRDYKDEEGELRTMPGIKHLVRYQQHLAAEEGVAFWNLFEAMGGEGSMARMVEADPPMANHDYTHINFRGGKRIAELLFEALMEGKARAERRRAYEAGE